MTDINSFMMEAESAFNDREWDLAIDKYKQVLDADPQNDEACTKLAEIYAIRGLVSNMVETYFTLMDILEKREEYDLAVEVARWIMKIQPENDKSRMKTILIYKKKGDMDEVVSQSLQLARLYIELGQGDQSILLLKNAQEIAPQNLDIGLELAEMYISHGHIQEGTNQYRKIANAYLTKGDYEKATEAFRRMKVVIPEDPQLLFTLGNLYMNLGKLNEAEFEFRAILRHNLNHTDALMALGEVCQKKGQFRDAILAYNKILTINPQDEKSKERLGELYHAQGSNSEAVKFYLDAAASYQYNEEIDKAIKLYRRVLSIDPSQPTACRELTNLGAPVVADDGSEEGSLFPVETVIRPVEDLLGDEADADESSLEEMAGILPDEMALDLDESLGDYENELEEFAPKQGAMAPKAAGAIPSAFGQSAAATDIRELKKEMTSELTYDNGQALSPDLLYDSEMEQAEEESGFGFEEEEPPFSDSDLDGEMDLGMEQEELEETDEDYGRRGLRKKEDDDDSGGRKGLTKKKQPEKKIRALRSGVVSTTSSVKKPSLPKRGLASKGKGLFRRRRQEEGFEPEDQHQEFPEPDMMEPETFHKPVDESSDEFLNEFEEAPLAFDEEGFDFESTMDRNKREMGGFDEELPSLSEGFGEMDEELPPLDGGEFDEEPKAPFEESSDEEDLFADIPKTQKHKGFPDEAPLGDELFPPLDEGEFDEEFPPLGEEMPFGETAAPYPEPEVSGYGEPSEIENLQDEMPEEINYDEAEDLEMPAAEPVSPESGLLGKKKKKPLSSLLSGKKQLKKEFTAGKKLTHEKLLGGRKVTEEEASGKKLLRRHEEEPMPEIQEPFPESQMPEAMEEETYPTAGPLSQMQEFTYESEYEEEHAAGLEEDEEELEPVPDFEAEFAQGPPAGDEFNIYPEVDDLTDLPEIEGLDDLNLEDGGFGGDQEMLPLEIPDLEEEETSIEAFQPDDIEPEEHETAEIVFAGSDMAQTLEDLENIDLEAEPLPLLEDETQEEETAGTGSFPSKPTSFLSDTGTFDQDEFTQEEGSEEEALTDLEVDLNEEGEEADVYGSPELAETSEITEEPGETGGLADFDDLLKLALEIENIIPDEDRIKEAEEQRRMEEEQKRQFEEEALRSTSFLDESALDEEDEHEPKSTSFLELHESADIPELTELEEEMSGQMIDEITNLDDMAIDTDQLALTDVSAPATKFLSDDEMPQPTGFLEGVEDAREIELSDSMEEVSVELIIEEETPAPPPEPDYKEEINRLMEEEQLEKALPHFVEAMAKHPDDEPLFLNYAEICYKYGLIDNAVEAYGKILQINPSNHQIRRMMLKSQLMKDDVDGAVSTLVQLGSSLTAEDKIDEAQRIFQHVLALQQENPVARESLSEIYLNQEMKQLALYHLNILSDYLEKQNSIEETIKVLKKIFSLTSDINTQEKLANVYINHQYNEEAISELQKLAQRYLESKDLNKAAGLYLQIVSMDGKNIEAHNRLVELYNSLKDAEGSYRHRVILADLMAENGELEEGIRRYQECLSGNNSDNQVRRKLMELYVKTDETEKAKEESKILSIHYHKEHSYEDAISMYGLLLDKLPNDLSLREKLSEFYILDDQFEKGLEQLTIVAEEQSREKDWDSAVKTYRKALGIDTRNADFHFRIGEIFLHHKKNNNEARYEFEKVFELDPTHRKAMESLIKLYIEDDKPSRAISILQNLIQLDGSYASMRDDIIEGYKSRIEENPNDYNAHFNLGVVYKELQMWKQAIEQFQTTRKSKDHVLESHNMLGICFAQQPPMLNLAVKTLEKGLELKGFDKKDYIELHYNLGTLYERMGKNKKAAVQYESALAIDSHFRDTAELLKQLKKKKSK